VPWIDEARAYLENVARDFPADISLKDRRKRFREVGSLFHGNTYWGRKKWGQAVREHLARHGGPPLPPKLGGSSAAMGRLNELVDRGDITFPFRKEGP
jgi:hypothetical protein